MVNNSISSNQHYLAKMETQN